MPRYEYECGNGHKTVVHQKMVDEHPEELSYCARAVWGDGETYTPVLPAGPLLMAPEGYIPCPKNPRRIYSTFSFRFR